MTDIIIMKLIIKRDKNSAILHMMVIINSFMVNRTTQIIHLHHVV